MTDADRATGELLAPDADASPPTKRVVRAIELLSRHPAERLSLARIVRATGMSRATAHAVLTQLTAEGWTVRDADGNYGLGLELVTVARRAEASFPLRRRALPALRDLAGTHDVPVFLAEREADSILITEVVGEPSVPWIRPGRRLPKAPPVCREFIAWAPESDRRAWLDAADPTHRARLAAVLDAIADRGYSVERLADDTRPMMDVLAALRSSPATDPLRQGLGALITDLITIDYLPDELGDHNAVVSIAAPIKAVDGQVVASVVACPDATLSRTGIHELAAATVATARAVG